jgi:hypothetical protein
MAEYIALSTAMREGAKLRPQAFGGYFQQGTPVKSCAMGAVYEALTGETVLPVWGRLPKKLRSTLSREKECPMGCEMQRGRSLLGLVTHLNDDHKWKREQIADWLASQGY